MLSFNQPANGEYIPPAPNYNIFYASRTQASGYLCGSKAARLMRNLSFLANVQAEHDNASAIGDDYAFGRNPGFPGVKLYLSSS